MSWSSGKDSAWALHRAERDDAFEVVGLLTTVNQLHDRVAMHGVRSEILRAQAQRTSLPLWEIPIPYPCSNLDYERLMSEAMERAQAEGVTHIIFGDLFLEDIRRYREDRLSSTGITPVFPLWGSDTTVLSKEMIEGGLVAHLATVDPKQLDPSFLGRTFDQDLIDQLPQGVDPCGENGEFHTIVTRSPSFSSALEVSSGERVERDGFWYCDFLLADSKPG